MDSPETPPHDRDELQAPRLLAAGTAALAASTMGTIGRWMEVYAERSAHLTELMQDAMADGERSQTAAFELRDEIAHLLREMGEIASHEARRAVDEFDRNTAPEDAVNPTPSRPYRPKP